MTAKDDLAHLRRLRERELRLRDLKRQIRDLKRSKPARVREIRAACKVGRQSARDAVRLLREETRIALGDRVRALREAERGTCETSKANALAELRSTLATVQDEEREWQSYVKRRYGRRKLEGLSGARVRRERREESDQSELARRLARPRYSDRDLAAALAEVPF